MSELKASLEQIAELTPTDLEVIERLPRRAATMSLDYAVHRCRIVIRLKHPAALSMDEKVATVQAWSLELTQNPCGREIREREGCRSVHIQDYRPVCWGESRAIKLASKYDEFPQL